MSDEPCPHGYPEELCDDCYAYWRAAGERFADDGNGAMVEVTATIRRGPAPGP